MTTAIEAVLACRRLCQMAHDAGLPSAAQQRLQSAVAALGVPAMFDATFAAWFKEAVIGFLNTLIVIKGKVDELDARLQPTRPASALPAALAGLRRNRLFLALKALDLPADTPENVHLEVALRGITRLNEKIVSKGNTSAAYDIDVSMTAFLIRRLTLEEFVQKHIDLADAAAIATAAAAAG